MIEITPESLPEQLAALEKMTATDLRRRYAEVFGERARSGNRQWLHRRIAWRLQLLAEGDLAQRAYERTRKQAKRLARDADLRGLPPRLVEKRTVAPDR
jgi:hypothetical protein